MSDLPFDPEQFRYQDPRAARRGRRALGDFEVPTGVTLDTTAAAIARAHGLPAPSAARPPEPLHDAISRALDRDQPAALVAFATRRPQSSPAPPAPRRRHRDPMAPFRQAGARLRDDPTLASLGGEKLMSPSLRELLSVALTARGAPATLIDPVTTRPDAAVAFLGGLGYHVTPTGRLA